MFSNIVFHFSFVVRLPTASGDFGASVAFLIISRKLHFLSISIKLHNFSSPKWMIFSWLYYFLQWDKYGWKTMTKILLLKNEDETYFFVWKQILLLEYFVIGWIYFYEGKSALNIYDMKPEFEKSWQKYDFLMILNLISQKKWWIFVVFT